MAEKVKKEIIDSAAAQDEILRAIQTQQDGLDYELMTQLTPSLDMKQRTEAVNSLLSSQRIVVMKGNPIKFMLNSGTQLAGATVEEQAVYSLIEESKTKGIWIKELRDHTNLTQVQLRKVLKSLENKKLIKNVKGVNSTKKYYMLYDLEPDTSLTGGTFYSDMQLDADLIHTLVTVCTGYIQTRRKHAMDTHPNDLNLQKETSYVRPQEVSDFIVEKKILNVSISVNDVERILDVAVLDGTIERRADGKVRAVPQCGSASALVSIPCGICPVVDDCRPGHAISPQTCRYMSDWLLGK